VRHSGDLKAVRLLPRQRMAFIEFANHEQAKLAHSGYSASGLYLKGQRLRVAFATRRKPSASAPGTAAAAMGGGAPAVAMSAPRPRMRAAGSCVY
jgi:hypothetical protein